MSDRRQPLFAILAALALVAGACGGNDDAADPATDDSRPFDQTVDVKMVDVAFEPDVINVKAGSTVRFVFTNEGRQVHDAAFGDEATQEAVEDGKQQRKGVELGPNGSKVYFHTFSQAGTVIIGCHQPGHYRQGMKARVTVA